MKWQKHSVADTHTTQTHRRICMRLRTTLSKHIQHSDIFIFIEWAEKKTNPHTWWKRVKAEHERNKSQHRIRVISSFWAYYTSFGLVFSFPVISNPPANWNYEKSVTMWMNYINNKAPKKIPNELERIVNNGSFITILWHFSLKTKSMLAIYYCYSNNNYYYFLSFVVHLFKLE